jgi:hypothetical protein
MIRGMAVRNLMDWLGTGSISERAMRVEVAGQLELGTADLGRAQVKELVH